MVYYKKLGVFSVVQLLEILREFKDEFRSLATTWKVVGSSTHLPFQHGIEVGTLRNLSLLILSKPTRSRLIRKFSLKNIRWKQAIDYGGKLTSTSGLHEYVHIHKSLHTMTHTHFNWHTYTHTPHTYHIIQAFK